MATNDCNKRKKWSRVETLGLLKCYLARKDEFKHARKKKFAYCNILEDMISQNLTDSSTSVTALEGKMRTLLTAYKSAKDNAKQTGATPCIPPYFEELEEIFGSKPLIANVHTLHLGRGPVSSLHDGSSVLNEPTDMDFEVSDLFEPIEVPSSFLPVSPDLPDPNLPSTSAAARSNKRKSPRECYHAAKLQLKAKAIEAKAAQRAAFYDKIHKSFTEKWKEENKVLKEAENKKIDLLEKILNKKN